MCKFHYKVTNTKVQERPLNIHSLCCILRWVLLSEGYCGINFLQLKYETQCKISFSNLVRVHCLLLTTSWLGDVTRCRFLGFPWDVRC